MIESDGWNTQQDVPTKSSVWASDRLKSGSEESLTILSGGCSE